MKQFDIDLFEALIDQIDTAVAHAGGFSNIAQWVEKNTSHPLKPNRPYSFKEHEYQIQIINDSRPQVAMRKATQIGASEAHARQSLGLAAKLYNASIIYVMPSIVAAQKFAATRIDTIIDNSRRLKAMVDRKVDSNTLKQIGTSFLHLTGAAKTSSAISIPAKALFIDEVAFADPEVVSVFTSRLGHQTTEESTKYIRYFSSPLHPHSDISYYYEQGDQNVYMCYHDKCGQWVMLVPIECITIPGFDDHLSNIQPIDLENPKYKIDRAYIKCPHCNQPITLGNLADPIKRSWVPQYPGREIGSYDANPLVLPTGRTPRAILESLRQYRSTTRWMQFALGCPAESASEMIMDAAARAAFTVKPNQEGVYGAVFGSDVGKTLHVSVGAPIGDRLDIIDMQTIVQTEGTVAGDTVVELYEKYKCSQGVMDAGPDISLPRYVKSELPVGNFWGCYFISGKGKMALAYIEENEEEGVIKVQRTRAMDEFVKQFNAGKVRLPMGLKFEGQVIAHLQKLKRVIDLTSTGEESAKWVTSDPNNHWFFSIFYTWLAAQQSQLRGASSLILPGSLSLGRVRMRSGLSWKS